MDWNEDGLKDLIVGMFNGRVGWYRNIGSIGNPQLTFAGYLQVNGHTIIMDYDSVPFVHDWNGDGCKDLLVGDMTGRVSLFINEGSNALPIFNQTQIVTLASGDTLHVISRSAPCMADLDGDGLEDLIMGQINGHASFFRTIAENPSPQLADPAILQIGGSTTLTPGPFSRFTTWDWDCDGRLDLLGGAEDGSVTLFRQINPGAVQPIPYMEINFQGPETVPDSGAVLNFTCYLENPIQEPLQFDIWVDLFGPDNRNWLSLRSGQVTLDAGNYRVFESQFPVSASAPYGYYQYKIYVGDRQRLQVRNSSSFEFSKVLCGRSGDNCSPQNLEVKGYDSNLSISPNPTNPNMNLNYSLPEAELVRLTIFNIKGEQISELANGYQEAGNYHLTWEARSVPSGVYFVELRHGSQRSTCKIILTK
ncbi:MAG: FG-GAP-like repeat-containing protein [bacterium]|nr:FG-GAP-like repeat-containing protein [bacterium]